MNCITCCSTLVPKRSITSDIVTQLFLISKVLLAGAVRGYQSILGKYPQGDKIHKDYNHPSIHPIGSFHTADNLRECPLYFSDSP